MGSQNDLAILNDAARRLAPVVDGIKKFFTGNDDEFVNNGTEDIPTLANLAKQVLEGVDNVASGAIEAAIAANASAQIAKDIAVLAADSSGIARIYSSRSDADDDLENRAEGDWVEVSADEGVDGSPRTRYKVVDGAYVLQVNLDQLRIDLSASTGAEEVKTASGLSAQDELNLKPHILDDVIAARALDGTPNYSVIHIKSSDGGLFVRDPSDTTSAEYDGAACGMIIRPADYATNGVYKRVVSGEVDVFWFLTPAQIVAVLLRTLAVDVTAGVQAALNAGNAIYAPGGSYLVSELSIADNKKFRGDGKDSTLFTSTAGVYTLAVTTTFSAGVKESIVNNRISDMTIKKVGTTAGTKALYMKRVTRFSLENLITYGGEKGLYLDGCIAGSARNCEFRSSTTGVYGITQSMSPSYNSNEISFYSCLFSYNGVGVETGTNCNNWKFFGGNIESNTSTGYLNSGVNDSVQFYGTWFEGQPIGCSFTSDVRSLVMVGCRWFDHSTKNFVISAGSMSNISIRSPIIMSGDFDLTNGNGEFMNPYVDASATLTIPAQGFTTNRSLTLGTNTVFSQTRNGGGINDFSGNNSPEGQVSGAPGSSYKSTSGKIYVKNTGTGNTGWLAVALCIEKTVTLNPAPVAPTSYGTIGPFSVSGAAFGDGVIFAAPYDLAGLIVFPPYVNAAGAVTMQVYNPTVSTIDLPSGDWKIKLIKA